MKKISTLILSLLLVPLLSSPAFAQHDDHWHGDIHHFHDYDFGRWRGGSWFHGFHGGRNGWWWIVGDGWYFYPAPVYPYPDPYVPPTIAVVPSAPSAWYYCANPPGYYPYVPQCFSPWQPVPATSAAVQPALAPTPVQTPAPQPSGSSVRDEDDRQLNAFGVEFSRIDPKMPGAGKQLRNLQTRVESYRQTLFTRNYNAMDILKDTEDLEHRIAAERALIKHKKSVPGNKAPDGADETPPPPPAGTPPPPPPQ